MRKKSKENWIHYETNLAFSPPKVPPRIGDPIPCPFCGKIGILRGDIKFADWHVCKLNNNSWGP